MISLTLSTAMKFQSKFFRRWSFFDQNQQPLNSVMPCEKILWALLTSQCPYKFFSYLNLRNASDRFWLFQRFRFCFPGSAYFSTRNLPSWEQYCGKSESFGKEFRQIKFIAVDRVTPFTQSNLFPILICFFLIPGPKEIPFNKPI